jgi:hypothetical protein
MAYVFPSDTEDREILEIFARMNATGYKLTAQELRNAKYFGEFKACCFGLAAGQLERWRKWGLFTDQQIARMAEVELASEFVIVILNGVSEGSKATIDRYYKNYDAEFRERAEVEKRFRHVMDQIEQKFDSSQMQAFTTKTLFYPLFCAVYSCTFGLKSPLGPTKATPIKATQVAAIAAAGGRITSGRAPEEIQKVAERRVSQAGVRRRLLTYLMRNVSGDD